MPPAPRGARISYGPSRRPPDRDIPVSVPSAARIRVLSTQPQKRQGKARRAVFRGLRLEWATECGTQSRGVTATTNERNRKRESWEAKARDPAVGAVYRLLLW